MTDYLIYAAREEEYDAGYVWLNNPAFPPRTPIELRIPKTKWKTFCESRHLDENFVNGYDARPRTAKIGHLGTKEIPRHILVISEWYRDALGGFQTSAHRNGERTSIQVRKLRILGLRNLRIAAHHPDFAVRIGLALGLLGTWLAIVGIASWVLDHLPEETIVAWVLCHLPEGTILARVLDDLPRKTDMVFFLAPIAIVAGLICWWPYRGPRQPHAVGEDQRPTGSPDPA